MDYIGSKEKINWWILKVLVDCCDEKILNGWFLDACAGSGSTSRYFARWPMKILSNDLFEFSSVIIKGSCQFDWERNILEAKEHIENMNNLEPIEGFFCKNYSDVGDPPRYFFTEENASLIDASRIYIEENAKNNEQIYNFLLWRLLEEMSAVSNTAGVQAAFLKEFKSRALRKLEFRYVEKNKVCFNKNIECYNKDLITLLKEDRPEESVIYVDPPYNSRQYGPNYHLYETLVKYDEPEISGVAGLRDWKRECKSSFCNSSGFDDIIGDIIENTFASVFLLSYSTDGLKSEREIVDFINSFSRVESVVVRKKRQRRFRADKSNERKYNKKELFELLFVVKIER